MIFARADHEFDLTQPLGYIFAHGSLGASVTAGTVRSAQRTNARMRHTPSPSADAYAECTRICSRIIKNTSVLFDQAAAASTGQLMREADVTFENEADGRRDARTNVVSTLAVNHALSRKRIVEKRVTEIILTFRQRLTFFEIISKIYLLLS